MKTSVILVSLLSLAFASPLETRADQESKILSDIKTLRSDTIKLNSTLNSFGDNAASIPIGTLIDLTNESNQVSMDINATTKASNMSSAFTASDSKAINGAISSFQPIILSTLQNFIDHKKAFSNAGVTASVEKGLESQRELTRELSNSLIKKSTAAYKKSGTASEKVVLAKFDSAIAAFSS